MPNEENHVELPPTIVIETRRGRLTVGWPVGTDPEALRIMCETLALSPEVIRIMTFGQIAASEP